VQGGERDRLKERGHGQRRPSLKHRNPKRSLGNEGDKGIEEGIKGRVPENEEGSALVLWSKKITWIRVPSSPTTSKRNVRTCKAEGQ